jgi:hypothetical protein
MSESKDQERRPDCVFELDDVQGFDVEAVRCPDAIAALLARQTSQTTSVDTMLTEFTDTPILPGDDPDCPAA